MDLAKLADCFAAVYPGLVLYARQWLRAAAAEDAAQEAFVKLMALKESPSNVKAWLYLATQRAALDAVRSDRRRQRRESVALTESGGTEPLFNVSPADPIDAADAEAALGGLPGELREVVLLRIWGQLTLAEIAKITDAAISTVHHRYATALGMLRQKLEPTCETKLTTRPSWRA